VLSFSAHLPFAPVWCVLCALLMAGCALPNRLSMANLQVDPLDRLTSADEAESNPSPYPTSLNNANRPQVFRPVTVAPAAPSPQPVSAPVPTPLPLQQTGVPAARPLDPQQLAGRLPVRIEGESPEAKGASERPSTPVTLSPNSLDIRELLAAKATAWPTVPSLDSSQTALPVATNVKVPVTPIEPAPVIPPVAWPPVDSSATKQLPPKEPEAAESREVLLQKLIASVEKEIRERNERKEKDELPPLEQKLRLLKLVADRSDDAVEKIDQLPPAEREAFKQLMFALSTWLSPDEAKRASLRNAKILRSLHEVDTSLSTVSKLDLKNLLFCEKVESFGWYTEFPRAEFAPKQQVILYVEVQNFAAEEKTATSFETELQGSYQIFDGAGNIVDERQLPLDREMCRNFRRDYFLAYRIYLPAELIPGRYRLELAIEDLKAKKDFKGRKQGEAMIEFAIK
jgi:hypothetical protein